MLDELHAYRGIFGAHLHHVLRASLRLARPHGAHPAIIAVVGDRRRTRDEFAELSPAGRSREIRELGSAARGAPDLPRPRPRRAPTRWRSTLLDDARSKRGQKTIAFTKARRITELLYGWLRAQATAPWRDGCACYRAGFLPEERREIEPDSSPASSTA